MPKGAVYLLGAGPGHPGLITVLGRDVLRRADVVACDRLIGTALLREVRADAEVIHVGKSSGNHNYTQAQIHSLLIDRAQAGKLVVRLKGGDPFVLGRGFEELSACRNAGVDCYVIPGITSAVAVPSSVGISVTDRRFVRSLAIVTGKTASNSSAPPLDYAALTRMDTVVVLMGRETLADLAQSLIENGRDPSTPAACIEWGTTSRQRVTVAMLDTIAQEADRDGLTAPIVTVVGAVAAEARQSNPPFLGPLFGRRIMVTRPVACGERLRQSLESLGGEVIHTPLIEIRYDVQADALDESIRTIDRYDWLVLTSSHGVQAFWHRIDAMNLDARTLSRCKVAVVGPATALAFERRGIKPDLVSAGQTGNDLVMELVERIAAKPTRVLRPHSDIAPSDLSDKLRDGGMIVDDVLAYRTVGVEPPETTRGILAEGLDAITFFSPSAVAQFARLQLEPNGASIICVGPTTAAAAGEVGLGVAAVAHEPSTDGMVRAIVAHLVGSPAG